MATRQREKRDASPGLKMQRFTVPFPFGSECGANSGSLYASSLHSRARAMFSKRLLLSYIALVQSLELASDDGGGRAALPNAETPYTLATMYSNNNTLLLRYYVCSVI